MTETAIRLLCCSKTLHEEVAKALDERGVCINERAEWIVLIDQPAGWAFQVCPSLVPNRVVVACDNPCPEYKLDLQGYSPAALATFIPFDQLAATVVAVQEGRMPCLKLATPLTPTERLTLRLVAKGATNIEIAEIRGVSLGTVKNTLSTVYLKLNLKHRLQASHYYYGRWFQLSEWVPPPHVVSLKSSSPGYMI